MMFDADDKSNKIPLQEINVKMKLTAGDIIEHKLSRTCKISELGPVYLKSLGINPSEVKSIIFSSQGKNLKEELTFDEISAFDNREEVIINVYHRLKGGF